MHRIHEGKQDLEQGKEVFVYLERRRVETATSSYSSNLTSLALFLRARAKPALNWIESLFYFCLLSKGCP